MKNLYSTQNKSQIEPTKVQIPNSRKETVSANPFFQPKKSFKSLFASLVIVTVFVTGIGSAWGQEVNNQTNPNSRLKNMAPMKPMMPLEEMTTNNVKNQNTSTIDSTESVQEDFQIDDIKEKKLEVKNAIELFNQNLNSDAQNKQKIDDFTQKITDEQRIKQINDVYLLVKSENLEKTIEKMTSNEVQDLENTLLQLNQVLIIQK